MPGVSVMIRMDTLYTQGFAVSSLEVQYPLAPKVEP